MTPRLPKAASFLALTLLAAPALTYAQSEEPAEPAPVEEQPAQAEPVEAAPVEEKKICKRIMAQAGSRRQTKICKTREEWKAYNEEQRNRSGRRN